MIWGKIFKEFNLAYFYCLDAPLLLFFIYPIF